jgi:hypothetical protein
MCVGTLSKAKFAVIVYPFLCTLAIYFLAHFAAYKKHGLRLITHYALFGRSLVFSCFHSFVSCGVSVKTGKF